MFEWLKQISNRSSFDKFFHWSNLHEIASSPLTSIAVYGTILVPFVAAQVRILTSIEILAFSPFGGLVLPIAMMMTYSFSLIFALASILALVSCPPIIKRHKNFTGYLAEVVGVSSGLRPKVNPEKENEVDHSEHSNEEDFIHLIEEFAAQLGAENYEATVHELLENAVEDWAMMEEENDTFRYVVGAMFLFSFLLGFLVFFGVMPASILFL